MLNTRASGKKWQNLGQIWVNFGQNGSFLNFRQKSKTVIFFVRFSKKMRKTSVFWHFGPKRAKLGQNGPKMGHFRIFGEKVKTSPSYPFFFIFQNKKSENSNVRFRRKSGTRRRRQTERQRRVTIYRSESARWASDQKMNNRKKCKKPLFLGILGQNGPNWAQKGPFSNFR